MSYETNLPGSVQIGYKGEKGAREIRLDISAELERWPDATPQLIYRRPVEVDAYPVVTTLESQTLIWAPDEFATEVNGSTGAAQIIFTDSSNEIIGKSRVIRVSCYSSIEPSENPPAPYESWLNQLLEAADQAADHERGAEDAQAGAETAQAGAEAAQAAAESARDETEQLIQSVATVAETTTYVIGE